MFRWKQRVSQGKFARSEVDRSGGVLRRPTPGSSLGRYLPFFVRWSRSHADRLGLDGCEVFHQESSGPP